MRDDDAWSSAAAWTPRDGAHKSNITSRDFQNTAWRTACGAPSEECTYVLKCDMKESLEQTSDNVQI